MNSLPLRGMSSQILEKILDGVIVSDKKDFKIIDLNFAAAKMFGYEKKELLGKDIYILHPSGHKSSIKNLINTFLCDESKYFTDIAFVRKNGEIFFCDICSSSIDSKEKSIFTAILRERATIKKSVTPWNIIYQNLAEMTGFGVCIIVKNKFIYVNQHLVEILGAETPLQLIGKKVTEFIPEEEYNDFKKNYEEIASGITGYQVCKKPFLKLNKERGYWYCKASKIMVNGEIAIQGVFSVAGDGSNKDFTFSEEPTTDKEPSVEILTSKEIEVLHLISMGYNMKEIASQLGISVHTIRTHKSRLMLKLNLQNSVSLTRFAIKNNIAPID